MKAPKAGEPGYQQRIELLANKGVEAIQKMPEATKAEIVTSLPGHASTIGQGMHGRLLHRRREELQKLIEDNPTTTGATAVRVGDLKAALRDESPKEMAKALAEIALKAGATVEEFTLLTDRLTLIAEAIKAGGVQRLHPDLKAALFSIATGDIAQLIQQTKTQLEEIAYRPLRQQIDVPRS